MAGRAIPALRSHPIDVVTASWVKRFVESALTITLSVGLAQPAVATAAPVVSSRLRAPTAITHQVVVEPPHSDPPVVRAPTEDPPPPAKPAALQVHTVVVGDNLWSIAAAELARRSSRAELSNASIAEYWGRLIASNRMQLRSGNPNLIFPGERVTLPR